VKAGVTGLSKLPNTHQGQYVYRHVGGKMTNVVRKLYYPGAIVTDLAFMSAAHDISGVMGAQVTKEDSDAGHTAHEVHIVIINKTGKNIEKESVKGEGEHEVLFVPGRRFKVIDRIERQNKDFKEWYTFHSDFMKNKNAEGFENLESMKAKTPDEWAERVRQKGQWSNWRTTHAQSALGEAMKLKVFNFIELIVVLEELDD
jgi:hypothetical protein